MAELTPEREEALRELREMAREEEDSYNRNVLLKIASMLEVVIIEGTEEDINEICEVVENRLQELHKENNN